MRLWQTHRLGRITLVRGSGCAVWDSEGKRYVDLAAGTWCNVLGYGHPRLVEAVCTQVGKLAHVGSAFRAAAIDEALSKLSEILPPALNRVVFLNTGSESVELSLKMAHAATGALGVAVIERGYYGATTYALSLSEAGRAQAYLPDYGNSHLLPAPECSNCPVGSSWPCDQFECLAPLKELAAEGPGELAAVLYEPVMGVGGMVIPPPGYGKALREIADRTGALLISEEVTTGVGRTGHWFGFELDSVVPDIVVIGKALGAGLPVAAVVTTEAVETRCRQLLRHVQSHQNDPLSGRVAATVISTLQEERLIGRAAERGAQLLIGLKRFEEYSSLVREVRGAGAMLGVEFVPERRAQAEALCERLLDEGFIVDYQALRGMLRLFPPYVISAEEVGSFLKAFERVLGQEVNDGWGAREARTGK